MKLIQLNSVIKEVDSEATGMAVKTLRKKKGVAIKDVAKETGMSLSLLYAMERGLRPWNQEKFTAVIKALKKLSGK